MFLNFLSALRKIRYYILQPFFFISTIIMPAVIEGAKVAEESVEEVKTAEETKSVKDQILVVKQKLKEDSNITSALEQFLELFSSAEDGLKYVEQYLSFSPDCKDLFSPSVVPRSNPKNIALVWNIVEKMLAGDAHTLHLLSPRE